MTDPITYNPLCIRVGESIADCVGLRALRDGGITVTHHYVSIGFMRDLDRDDAQALYRWLGDHLMRSAAVEAESAERRALQDLRDQTAAPKENDHHA